MMTFSKRDGDVIVTYDFRGWGENRPVRPGTVSARCPRCGLVGEKRRNRVSTTFVHVIEYREHCRPKILVKCSVLP